jgi:hypothetical protein
MCGAFSGNLRNSSGFCLLLSENDIYYTYPQASD